MVTRQQKKSTIFFSRLTPNDEKLLSLTKQQDYPLNTLFMRTCFAQAKSNLEKRQALKVRNFWHYTTILVSLSSP